MKFSILSSSSSGNVVYLEHNNHHYLIDCGIGIRAIQSRLNNLNIHIEKLDGIFISHEHTDHVYGLPSVSSKLQPRIYMSKLAYRNMNYEEKERISPILFTFFNKNEEFIVDTLKIYPFGVSHDAADPVGFKIIDENENELVYLTDTGCFLYPEIIKNASAYIIESNHEPDLLLNSMRPWPLKNRILSNLGHLSNDDSAALFANLYGDKTKLCVLYHLSSECNSKELALMAYKNYFQKRSIDVSQISFVVSDRTHETKIYEV